MIPRALSLASSAAGSALPPGPVPAAASPGAAAAAAPSWLPLTAAVSPVPGGAVSCVAWSAACGGLFMTG